MDGAKMRQDKVSVIWEHVTLNLKEIFNVHRAFNNRNN